MSGLMKQSKKGVGNMKAKVKKIIIACLALLAISSGSFFFGAWEMYKVLRGQCVKNGIGYVDSRGNFFMLQSENGRRR